MNNVNEKLRIAMLGHKRIPSREGGIEVVVEELAVRMVKRGHDVTCYNRKGHHVAGSQFDVGQIQEYEGIKVVEVPTVDFKGLAAVSASVFGAIKSVFGRFDVVHFHAEGPSFMCWLPKMMKKRVIVTVHGLDWQRAKWGKFASWYIKTGEKNAVRFADEIIVLSREVQAYFKKAYNRDTIYIPNGVNRPVKEDANLITQKYMLEKDSYILFLGRIVPEKGLRYLVSAWKSVRTDKKLVIAGGASDTDAFLNELRELAGNDERIIFTGFVQGKMLDELYSNAYLYVLPSDVEGMPLSLLEAMSYGNACLVSDIAECAEVVEDKAEMFRRGDVADLVNTMQTLLDNSSIVEKMKNASSDFICNKHSWDYVVDQTLDVYRG